MTDLQISTTAMLLCLAPAIVHTIEVVCPMWSRFIVNIVLQIFTPGLPNSKKFLTNDEQITMLDAALSAAPENKSKAAADYIFLLLFEQRQGALAFISLAAGVFYGLNLDLADRHALHFIFGVMSVLFTLVNANHAGISFLLGYHPKVSRSGRNVGIIFAPFWILVSVLNYLSFSFAIQ
ncbi:MAG: hypothetical protein AB8E15_00805 [Bdellovibrionales bacterium]